MIHPFLRVPLTFDDFIITKKFAVESYESSKDCYEERNQGEPQVVIPQIQIGKITEVAVRRWLRRIGVSCSDPDFKTYASQDKTYREDLTAGINGLSFLIGVKGQETDKIPFYRESWSFTKGDPNLITPGDAYVIPVGINRQQDYAHIRAAVPLKLVAASIIKGLPVKKSLEPFKSILYFEDAIAPLAPHQRWAMLLDMGVVLTHSA